MKDAKREELVSAIRRAPEAGFVFGSSIMNKEQCVEVVLRYISGQQFWTAQSAPGSTVGTEGRPEISALSARPENVDVALPEESRTEFESINQTTTTMDHTMVEDPDVMESGVELVISSAPHPQLLLPLYIWLKEEVGDVQEIMGSWSGKTVLRVAIRQPIPLVRMLGELPYVLGVYTEPYIGPQGTSDAMNAPMHIGAGKTLPRRLRLDIKPQ